MKTRSRLLAWLPAALLGPVLALCSSLALAESPAEAAKAHHLLDYIGADYPPTVQDGKVIDEGEYREQQEFSAVLADLVKALGVADGRPETELVAERDKALATASRVLIVPGSSFNVPYRHHFRVTLLPEAATMREVFARIDRALSRRAEAATKVVPIKGKSRPAAA